MLDVNSRYPLTYDDGDGGGGGIVFALAFTFTLRPMSGPFVALITLMLEKLFYLHQNYHIILISYIDIIYFDIIDINHVHSHSVLCYF